MKKIISIVIFVLVFVGLGVYLYKISPQERSLSGDAFDLSGVVPLEKPQELLPTDHFLGDQNAKNSIVVFEDLQCPACAAFIPTLKEFFGKITDSKLIFRHYPLTTIHRNASYAAFASESAAAQNKFWEFVDILYAKQQDWSDLSDPTAKFVEYAKTAGVADLKKFEDETVQKLHKKNIENGIKEGLGLKITGTPTIFFNGTKLEISRSADTMLEQASKLKK